MQATKLSAWSDHGVQKKVAIDMGSNLISCVEDRSGGVYAIVNCDKQKIYIGESQDMRLRSQAHINLLKSGKHSCKDLQQDYNNGDKIEIIKIVDIPGKWNTEKRLCAEDYYITCFREKGVELYNNPRDKKCKDNFFILACRNDKTVVNLFNKIHKNRTLTKTRK